MTKVKRCKICKKKIKLSDLVLKQCQCANLFCIHHSAPWQHNCDVVTEAILKRQHKEYLVKKLVKTNVRPVYNKL
jgi:predicted nucleic acid binding AN1-type Zn finger protein